MIGNKTYKLIELPDCCFNCKSYLNDVCEKYWRNTKANGKCDEWEKK